MFRNRQRRNRGTSIIEVLIGSIFFVPIALFALNLVTIVMTTQINDHLAKDAARAAANQVSQAEAKDAALKTLSQFQTSSVVQKVSMEEIAYDSSSNGQVQVRTSIEVRFPVPFPGFESRKFVAQSVEPIVGTPTPL